MFRCECCSKTQPPKTKSFEVQIKNSTSKTVGKRICDTCREGLKRGIPFNVLHRLEERFTETKTLEYVGMLRPPLPAVKVVQHIFEPMNQPFRREAVKKQ